MTVDVYLASVLTEKGVNSVYIGEPPAVRLNCVALKMSEGFSNARYFGMISLGEPTVEVTIRNDDYATGKAISKTVYESLDKLRSEENGILSCLSSGSVGYLGRDADEFHEWRIIFNLILSKE